MKRIIALILTLMFLLSACGNSEPAETTLGGEESQPTAGETISGEGEGVLDPTTEIRYLIVKKIVTNDQGEELWGTEYSYDNTGFCTQEREYSNIGTGAYSRVNSPDMLSRIGSSLFTELDGSQYTVTYTYDDFDRCVLEHFVYEGGMEKRIEYTYNEQGNYLTLKEFINDELIMDYAFSYTYDGQGKLVSRDEYLGGELLYHVAFTYDEQGREVGSVTSLVNGEVQTRTESQWDGLTETRLDFSGQDTEPFMISVFTYDDAGNVVFEEKRQGDSVIYRAEYIYEPFEVKK